MTLDGAATLCIWSWSIRTSWPAPASRYPPVAAAAAVVVVRQAQEALAIVLMVRGRGRKGFERAANGRD